MPLRSIAFLAYFFASSMTTFAYPMAGVICYIVLYHVYPQTTWWGKALEPFGLRYSFICGICLLVGATLNLNRLRFGRSALHPVEVGLILLFLVMVLSTVTGGQWDIRTEFVLDKMWKVFLFVLVMAHVVTSRSNLWQLTVLLSALALYLGHEARNAPPGAFTENRLNGIGGPDFRESVGLALHLLALLPFVVILLRQKALWYRVLAILAATYSVNAIILCRARAAFVAAIAAGLAALFYVPRRHRMWVGSILVVGLMGGIFLADSFFWNRMVTIFYSGEERDRSAASRIEIWTAAWEMLKDNPLGVGVGQFEARIGDYGRNEALRHRDAHNTFVLCAGELGFAGLFIYVATLGGAWMTLHGIGRKTRELADPDIYHWLVFANRLALIVYTVGGLFTSRFYTEGVWWLILMPVCLTRSVENELKAQADAAAASIPRTRSTALWLGWRPGVST
jgi:probable O-glycosylation ligase (exosortase A-associated)